MYLERLFTSNRYNSFFIRIKKSRNLWKRVRSLSIISKFWKRGANFAKVVDQTRTLFIEIVTKLFGRRFRPFRSNGEKFLRHGEGCSEFMLPPLALAINIRTSLFRNAFWLRFSNGATNHCRNDLDVGRSAIIATCILLLYLRFELDTIEDESPHQLSIFNLDVVYTRAEIWLQLSVFQIDTC